VRTIDTADVEPDAAVAAKVAEYESELSKELDIAVGKTTTELDSRRASVRGGETAIGNLIADAMRHAVGADVAITNGGGIRGDKTYPAGSELTRRDILTELPFGNKNLLLEVSGQGVIDALENGVSQVENGAGRFPQISGLTFTLDASKSAGSRVSNVMVGDKPIDPAASYKVSTNDFMANGGDGYTVFRSAKVLLGTLDGKLMANDVMAYVRSMGEVSPSVGGRIAVK
jgi:2',3'-cyclic-nucleotide 2'-phosphodiesterase (5'-nucleotidase family)